MLRAILRQHGADCDEAAGEDTRTTSGDDHLPQRLTEPEESRKYGNADQAADEDWLSSVSIRRLGALDMDPNVTTCTYLAPEDHQDHLSCREQALDQSGPEAHLFCWYVADLLDHEVDVRKDAEEGNGLHNPRETKQEDLGQR